MACRGWRQERLNENAALNGSHFEGGKRRLAVAPNKLAECGHRARAQIATGTTLDASGALPPQPEAGGEDRRGIGTPLSRSLALRTHYALSQAQSTTGPTTHRFDNLGHGFNPIAKSAQVKQPPDVSHPCQRAARTNQDHAGTAKASSPIGLRLSPLLRRILPIAAQAREGNYSPYARPTPNAGVNAFCGAIALSQNDKCDP